MSDAFIPIFDEYRQGERDFSKFFLEKANLRDAILPDINLQEADLNEAVLLEADLTNANLRKAVLTKADLSKAKLSGADFTEANLMGAKFIGADLSGAVLNKAFLRLADFTDANLTGASLIDADGRGWVTSSESQGVVAHRTSFQNAILSQADLSEAYLRLCDFRGADLGFARLVNTDLSSVDGRPTSDQDGNRKPVILRNAYLRNASLRKAQFSYCDFRNSDLHGADLREAVLGGSFKEADLSQALFHETQFANCDLTDAKLTGTNLAGVKFTKVRMPDGKPVGTDLAKFIGPPLNPEGTGTIYKIPEYVEFWFETYEEVKVLSWPLLCICCGMEYDRLERITKDRVKDGQLQVYEVRVPYCTACLQHSVRSGNVKAWMKSSCTAHGVNLPAVKFEYKSRGMLSSKMYFVLSFTSPDYVIGFASGNSLPSRGFKGNW